MGTAPLGPAKGMGQLEGMLGVLTRTYSGKNAECSHLWLRRLLCRRPFARPALGWDHQDVALMAVTCFSCLCVTHGHSPSEASWTSAPREATEVDEVILLRNKTCIGRNRLEAFAQVLLNRPFAMKRSVLF